MERLNPFQPTTIQVPTVSLRSERRTSEGGLHCSNPKIARRESVGPGNSWTKLVCRLPSRSTPGLELVAISRVAGPESLMILPENLTMDRLMKIGQSKAYQPRRDFERNLRDRAVDSDTRLEALIAHVDPNQDNPTFDGGFKFLLSWYRAIIDAQENI
jgi:hypothetical protein